MMKRLTLSVSAIAFLTVALGAGTKVRSLAAVGAGLTENCGCDGMAMLTYNSHQDRTDVQVVINDFLPNTVYGVMLDSSMGGFTDPIAIETNEAGNGNCHISGLAQNKTGSPIVTIFRSSTFDVDNASYFSVEPGEIRAIGTAP